MNSFRFKNFLDGIYILAVPTDYNLIETIFGANENSIFKRRQNIFNVLPGRKHREHGAILWPDVFNCVTPTSRGTRPNFRAPRSGSSQRGELSEAMTCNHVDTHSHIAEYFPSKKVAQIHRPLRLPDPDPQEVISFPCDI